MSANAFPPQTLRVDRYSLLGWCHGGRTALIAASRDAGRVHKLAVWGCNAFVTGRDVEYYETTRDLLHWPDARRRPLLERYGEEYTSRAWNAWVDEQRSALRDRDGDLCRAELRSIVAPTLVLHGAEDRLVPTRHAVYLHENVAGSA